MNMIINKSDGTSSVVYILYKLYPIVDICLNVINVKLIVRLLRKSCLDFIINFACRNTREEKHAIFAKHYIN